MMKDENKLWKIESKLCNENITQNSTHNLIETEKDRKTEKEAVNNVANQTIAI